MPPLPTPMHDAAGRDTPGLWVGQLRRDICEAPGTLSLGGQWAVGGRAGFLSVQKELTLWLPGRASTGRQAVGRLGRQTGHDPGEQVSVEVGSGLMPRKLMLTSHGCCREVCSGCVVGEYI